MNFSRAFLSILSIVVTPCMGANDSIIHRTGNNTKELAHEESILFSTISTTPAGLAPLRECSPALQAELCPPWHFCDNTGQCKCGINANARVKCETNGGLSVMDSYCVTFDTSKSRSEVGFCIYNHPHVGHDKVDNLYNLLPSNASELDEVVCGKKFNRQGTLCGSCKPNYYPQAFSYNMTCVKCDHIYYNWFKYILLAYLPLTVFYFTVLFFQVSVLHSHLDGFVLFSQAASFPALCRMAFIAYYRQPLLYLSFKIQAFFYGTWNLDCLRSFSENICLHSNSLFVTSLGFAIALYPMALIILTYVLIVIYDKGFKPLVYCTKPIRFLFRYFQIKLEIKTSLVDTFSTFFLLSNVKMSSVAVDLLAPVGVHFLTISEKYSRSYKLYLNPTINYFGEDHYPYAVISLAILVPLVILPILTLTIYPFKYFQRCLHQLPHQLQIVLHTYVDTFYGSYKDGTESGSWDCRWFASLIILTRSLLILLFGYTLNMMYFVFGSIMLLMLTILVITCQPFKKSSRNNFLVLYLLCLVGLYTSVVGSNIASYCSWRFISTFKVFIAVFGTAPLLYTFYLLVCWIFHRKCVQEFRYKDDSLRTS